MIYQSENNFETRVGKGIFQHKILAQKLLIFQKILQVEMNILKTGKKFGPIRHFRTVSNNSIGNHTTSRAQLKVHLA